MASCGNTIMINSITKAPRLSGTRQPGFTIVELLVVIGVMALLMGLLLPALRSVRQTASQSSEMSAARQLMLAYQTYANGNRDRVIPGYSDELPALDAAGRRIGVDVLTDIRGPAARARYPWRIAPYLDYELLGLYVNENQELLEQYQQEDYDSYVYGVSLFPSLALNATWVGGNSQEGGFDPTNLQVFGQYYVTTPTQVAHTDRLLVFASARGGGDPFDPQTREGNYRLLSPYLQLEDGYRWSESFNPGEPPSAFGFVSLRYAGRAVSAFIDGHVDVMGEEQFKDMRYWANDADRPDWALEPQTSTQP